MRAALLAASFAFMTTGCASIFSDNVYPVEITSSPRGASIEISNEDGNVIYNGTTPAVVKLTSDAGYFDGEQYTVKFSKPGYSDELFVVDSKVDGWYWGNLLIGGPLGMLLIDPLSGSMYSLPTKASATLKAQEQPLVLAPTTSAVADNAPLGKGQWREQQLLKLQRETGLSYEEYMIRYREIMAQ